MGTFYAIGCIISPISGGALVDKFGFSICCDVMSMIALVFGIIFICFYFLPEICLKKRKSKTSSTDGSMIFDEDLDEVRGSFLEKKGYSVRRSVLMESSNMHMKTQITLGEDRSFRPVSEQMDLHSGL